jgi:hypothetical protein
MWESDLRPDLWEDLGAMFFWRFFPGSFKRLSRVFAGEFLKKQWRATESCGRELCPAG